MNILKPIFILLGLVIHSNAHPAAIGEHDYRNVALDNSLTQQMDPKFRPKKNWEKFREMTKQHRNVKGRKHINRVPPPFSAPNFDDLPSGLSGDQKQSTSQYIDDSLHGQRKAFLAMLNDHQRHPKQFKHIDVEDRYIILSYDDKTKRYSIVEDSGE